MDFKLSQERAELQSRVQDIETQIRELQHQIDGLEMQKRELNRRITSITPEAEQELLLQRLYEERHNKEKKEKK